jgi:elongator complex protein 3
MRRNPQEIKLDDLNSDSKGILNIFENLHTEIQVAKLKRLIMRDAYWTSRVNDVRKKINSKVDASGSMPNNPELLALYKELCEDGLVLNSDGSRIIKDNKVEQILKRLKVRSNSGVAVISLLTKPYTCPGRCIYCPTEKNMPKSYLSREPAAARALLNRFDPYKQIWMRLRALTMNGHPVDKIEMIFIGGTWNYYDKEYQEYFTKESFRACNNWKAKEEGREIIEEGHNYTLEDLQVMNESAHARIIGLSIETRPDYIIPQELKWLRYLGVTKVELGVQHLNDKVLEYNKREMTERAMAYGTEMLRDYGFKIVYHMMPNLPKSNPEMDVEMFKNLYNGLDHHPDMLKIYPCMVLRGSILYKWVTRREIEYRAYDDALLTRVLADAESYVPCYTRLIRVIRDIPADYIIIGSKKSNLREDVDKFQKARGIPQVDIRSREIRDSEIYPSDYEMTETWYETSNGHECFLQFESKKNEIGENKLAGFLRLRLPKNIGDNKKEIIVQNDFISGNNWGLKNWYISCTKFYQERVSKTNASGIGNLLEESALVRELHVYGTMKRVGEEGNQSQHTGMGKRLLARAEEISRGDNKNKLKYKKLSIISGVGVREYYRKRGYNLVATYMVKDLD